MSHVFIKAACASAGLVLALAAAGTAYAAKPIANSKPNMVKKSLTIKQKNEMAAAMARNYNGKSKAPPKTAAKAEATLFVMAGGGEGMEVPTELYNYLGASPDATGKVRVRDIDPNAESVSVAVEASDEK